MRGLQAERYLQSPGKAIGKGEAPVANEARVTFHDHFSEPV